MELEFLVVSIWFVGILLVLIIGGSIFGSKATELDKGFVIGIAVCWPLFIVALPFALIIFIFHKLIDVSASVFGSKGK